MSFRLRITLCMIAVIAVLFSIGGAVLISTSFNISIEKEEQTAVDNTDLALRMLQLVGEREEWFDEETLTDTLRQIAERGLFDAAKLFRQGSGDGKDAVLYEFGNTRGITDGAGGAETGKILVTYPANHGKQQLVTTSALKLGRDVYVLCLSRDLGAVYRIRAQQRSIFNRIYFILLAVAAFLSWIAATVMTRSLRLLSRASREIASGNLSYRSNIRSEDEIGTLSRDFDTMAARMEENMHALQEEADRKERFMGAFTHELKTPMTSIIGYADLIRSQDLTEEEQADALNYIFSEGKRLENMSLKLLDLFVADKTEISLQKISPAQLAEDVAEHLRPVMEKAGIECSVQGEAGECGLEPDLIRTLLINLIDNARKAMPEGGAVKIRTKLLPDGCVFCVSDTGKGMAKEEIAHITEAFYRVDKARARSEGSAGLGLALCDKIVQLHRGTLRFESEPGKGTTVIAELHTGGGTEA